MATQWGLCGAGKISHDFSMAMKTLPPEHHQVLSLNKLNHEQSYLKEQQCEECVCSPPPMHTDSSHCIKELGACQRLRQEAWYSYSLWQL